MIGWVYDKAKQLGNTVAEGFSSKTGEKIADLMGAACGCVFSFKTNFDNLDGHARKLKSKAMDINHQVENEELGGRKKRKREVQDWLNEEEGFHQEVEELKNKIKGNELASHVTRAYRVVKLSKRLKKHLKKGNDFGDLVLDVEKGRETFLLDKIYGAAYQKILEDIFPCVKEPNHQIIGIYGAEKAGKTALAKHIHNQVIERIPDRVYWVEVSENTSEKKLQDDICDAIGLILDENEVGKRAMRLNRALKAKKNFVLILDNLMKYLDLRMVGFPVGEDGCRLIITTRSPNMCRKIGCQRTFEVNMIEEEAWNMFREVYGQDPTPREEYFKTEVNRRCGFPERIIKFARDPEVDDSEFSD